MPPKRAISLGLLLLLVLLLCLLEPAAPRTLQSPESKQETGSLRDSGARDPGGKQETSGWCKQRPGKLLIRTSSSSSTSNSQGSAQDTSAADVSAAEAELALLGLRRTKGVGSAGWMLAEVQDGDNETAKVERLRALGYDVELDWAVSALKVPSDSSWSSIAQAMNRISAPAAWDTFTGSADITVCVIDTGIDMTHPDLVRNMGPTSYNAITDTESPQAGFDDNSHGTHCSGTIGGVGNNKEGVAGVSWKVQLLACKFLGSDGSGYTSDAVDCITWCRNKRARITSNSWGGGGFSQALSDEIQKSLDAGHLFIAAAGNANTDIDSSPSYPAAYPHSNIIAVGAVDPADDTRASFSNYGASNVDLFAPGVNIYSTVPGNKYATFQGTSMACPHVAGAAALVWSYRPSLTADQVKTALMSSVDTVPGLSGLCVTGGRLNVAKAIKLAAGSPSLPIARPGGRCGKGVAACGNRECCSLWGRCGTSWLHCRAGCQKKYGVCK